MKAAIASLLLLSLAGCGRSNPDELLKVEVEQHLKRAVRFEEENELDAAIAEYRRAIARVQGQDRWKTLQTEWRALVKQLEEQKSIASKAGIVEFERFKDRVAADGCSGTAPLYKEGTELRARFRESNVVWLPELDRILAELGKRLDEKR